LKTETKLKLIRPELNSNWNSNLAEVKYNWFVGYISRGWYFCPLA